MWIDNKEKGSDYNPRGRKIYFFRPSLNGHNMDTVQEPSPIMNSGHCSILSVYDKSSELWPWPNFMTRTHVNPTVSFSLWLFSFPGRDTFIDKSLICSRLLQITFTRVMVLLLSTRTHPLLPWMNYQWTALQNPPIFVVHVDYQWSQISRDASIENHKSSYSDLNDTPKYIILSGDIRSR